MPPKIDETLTVHVNVEITVEALSTIVEDAKQRAGKTEKGDYRVDTAAAVGDTISKFMEEKNFTDWVRGNCAGA